jgi:2-oxoglutarate ferredoxin oxidoreductase subunit delta
MPKIIVDRDRCKGCERCVAACPQRIISITKEMNLKGYFFAHVHDPSRCIGCRMCAVTCPDVAINVGVNGTQYHFFEY